MALCGPALGSQVIDNLDGALHRRRFQYRCGLEPDPIRPLPGKSSEGICAVTEAIGCLSAIIAAIASSGKPVFIKDAKGSGKSRYWLFLDPFF